MLRPRPRIPLLTLAVAALIGLPATAATAAPSAAHLHVTVSPATTQTYDGTGVTPSRAVSSALALAAKYGYTSAECPTTFLDDVGWPTGWAAQVTCTS